MAGNFSRDADDVGSTFSEDSTTLAARSLERQARHGAMSAMASSSKAPFSVFREEAALEEGRRQRQNFLTLNAYERHKMLVNEYYLYFPGATERFKRDTSKDRNDLDVIKEHHRFLWENDSAEDAKLSWEQKLARKYCQKLFKEYAICDLSRYKDNKVAMRWRTESELKLGKGQFVCGSRKCNENELLRTWEVNFAYMEDGDKKNALVKVRLCPDCSYKLNYHHKRKEVTKRKEKKKKKRSKKDRKRRHSSSDSSDEDAKYAKKVKTKEEEKAAAKKASDIWSAPIQVEQEKTREEDFSEYLEDLFL